MTTALFASLASFAQPSFWPYVSRINEKERVAGDVIKPVTIQSAKFACWDADFIGFLWFLIDVGYQNKPKSIFDVALKT